MPGDTKIKRASGYPSGGWIDVDNPTVVHDARWKARAARRGSLPSTVTSLPRVTQNIVAPTPPAATPSVTSLSPLTGLQQRLVNRLTTWQGVSLPEALVVVNSYGYNAAASYGHMREAGATHAEAVEVINRDDPDASLVYGKARAAGHDHVSALRLADAGDAV